MTTGERWLFIDPPTRHFEQDRLFGMAIGGGGIDAFEAFAYLRRWLRERGVRVHTADLIDAFEAAGLGQKLYVSFGMRNRYSQLESRPDVVLSGLFAFECPIVEPTLYRDLHRASRSFRRIFSYSTEQALEPFVTGPVQLLPFRIPQFFNEVDDDLWGREDRRFLVMINGNKVPPLSLNELYTERLRGLAFFAQHDEIDLYGIGWDGPALRVGDRRLPGPARRLQHAARRWWHARRPPQDPFSRAIRATYRGPANDKAATLAEYTFALCFENSKLDGWVTEKIFDCFYSGTIPIYLGAPDIEQWVPSECFIDMRRFSGYNELRDYLQGLSESEIEAFRTAARDYVRSELFRPFTKQAFAELIGSLVEEDTGQALEVAAAAAG